MEAGPGLECELTQFVSCLPELLARFVEECLREASAPGATRSKNYVRQLAYQVRRQLHAFMQGEVGAGHRETITTFIYDSVRRAVRELDDSATHFITTYTYLGRL